MKKLTVLYEDNHVIAVYKPAGILTQEDTSGETSLLTTVKEYIKVTHHKPGNVFLGLVHRLDRNVSGIVIFGKTSKGASRLSEQFRSRNVTKIYTALVHGSMPEHGSLHHYLFKNKETNTTKAFNTPHHGAKLASLSFTLLRRIKDMSLISVTLETGRSHQIRAQLAHIGHPIIGDVKYGSTHPLPDHRISLCATQLSFNHVISGERISLSVKERFDV